MPAKNWITSSLKYLVILNSLSSNNFNSYIYNSISVYYFCLFIYTPISFYLKKLNNIVDFGTLYLNDQINLINIKNLNRINASWILSKITHWCEIEYRIPKITLEMHWFYKLTISLIILIFASLFLQPNSPDIDYVAYIAGPIIFIIHAQMTGKSYIYFGICIFITNFINYCYRLCNLNTENRGVFHTLKSFGNNVGRCFILCLNA